ncbi:CWF19-like protein 2 [Quillaja saponaria]|uniref:CWF19-like protein 2 n=1 Tax=Quillaja saponaria TaxID=32244 RepID=A0AAD7KNC2_QUISA|nr:CWF19-like protein 2 [Quillaja saponaria]
MLGGVKIIPRDQINKGQDEDLDSSLKRRKKSSSKKEKHKRKNKSSRYSSSEGEELQRIKKGSRKKKWYSSEEHSSSYSSESESDSERDEKKHRRRAQKRSDGSRSGDDAGHGERSKKRSRSGTKEASSEDYSDVSRDGMSGARGTHSLSEKESARKEMGLEWMLRPGDKTDRRPAIAVEKLPEEAPTEEIKVNPRELNPYYKDSGSGYPEDIDGAKVGADKLLSSSLIGDGGASWRLKALKRAQEQAAREGRRLEEIVGERWGSLGQLTVSVASNAAAPSRAHLHAIKNRQRGQGEELTDSDDKSGRDSKRPPPRGRLHAIKNRERGHGDEHPTDPDDKSWRDSKRDYLKDVSVRHREMREPKVRDSLSWGKRKSHNVASKDAGIISAAVSGLNKFTNDGNFMSEVLTKNSTEVDRSDIGNVKSEKLVSLSEAEKPGEISELVKDGMSANQLAAKALQLRLKGKHEEAEKLLQEAKNINTNIKQGHQEHRTEPRNEGRGTRYAMQEISVRQKKREDDTDLHLAHRIMQNKTYSLSGRADDEYDFEGGESRKSRKKQGGDDHKTTQKGTIAKRVLTQQERCLFCLENPNRPMHLVVSIANFTYLMLPQWQSVVPGHCCILPIQHESATRTVDDNAWLEIRNFKKCLIMMFAKQEKDIVFLETVMGLAQQRRHCMIECIPLPQQIAKEAPLYFKKAIDEAEDEWSQHNAKKLIDTSEKGLRNSIPKHFPYFHVEFGLDKGFVHVIDDEMQFKSSLGLNVIRGMLDLPEEDMYRRRRYESVDVQKQAVASFCKEWQPFDWTKQLHGKS